MNKENSAKQRRPGPTLIKLLLLIVLVAIISGAWFQDSRIGEARRRAMARIEMKALVTAFSQYEADNAPVLFSLNQEGDVTSGLKPSEIQGFRKIDSTSLVPSNSDIMVVLMDIDGGINLGHVKNARRLAYIELRVVNDTKSPGFSTIDHQFRDPWGNPYVISIDANGDGRVRDAVYANAGMIANNTTGMQVNSNGIWEVKGSIMVWSRGPDGKAGMDAKDKDGVNKDNVVSWQ